MVNIIVVVILARLVGVVLTDSSAAQLMRSLDHVQQIVLRHITLVRQRTDAVIHRLSYTVLTGAKEEKITSRLKEDELCVVAKQNRVTPSPSPLKLRF